MQNPSESADRENTLIIVLDLYEAAVLLILIIGVVYLISGWAND